MHNRLGLVLAAGAAIFTPSQAYTVNNDPPPAGPVILDLAGSPLNHSYQQFTTQFIATGTLTKLTFAAREDSSIIILDDITAWDTTRGGSDLIVNGGFEADASGTIQPTGWSYFDPVYGWYDTSSTDCGFDYTPYAGSCAYGMPPTQHYEWISQIIATTPGDVYGVSFYEEDHIPFWSDPDPTTIYQQTSTNGLSLANGNGRDVVVYASPVAVPEPATATLLGALFAGLMGLRRRKRA